MIQTPNNGIARTEGQAVNILDAQAQAANILGAGAEAGIDIDTDDVAPVPLEEQ